VRLTSARVQNYRSVRDTGWFDIESAKTIVVGPNEAGKTAVLQALQQIHPPDGTNGFDPLRDYPRSSYNADLQSGRKDPKKVPVASAKFRLEADDLAALGSGFEDAVYVYTRYLGNNATHDLEGGPALVEFTEEVRKDLDRMAAHVDKQSAAVRTEGTDAPSVALATLTKTWALGSTIHGERATKLREWLDAVAEHVDEENTTEDNRHTRLLGHTRVPERRDAALKTLAGRRPVFVLFNNYFSVKPNIHLSHLADRTERNLLDDDRYDYGNLCLLKFLGFTARELAELGAAPAPADNAAAFEAYRKPLDERDIKLNAASVHLSNEIRKAWNPNLDKGEASTLRVKADGQYLKVVVEDQLGVEVELDQRSEGYQWLVSFFIVFFAEAASEHKNAILLLDEPGLSLHGLKQREFRQTLSQLAEDNQTIYTTHSPFLVGPDELDLVRVVEMPDRALGTRVHTNVTAADSAALLPLQEALGYDLAQSMFTHQRNLILEGLTDYWYLDATSALLGDAGGEPLNDKIALLPANTAGKVVYFATILHANKLKVAALLDSDNAGDSAAKNDVLVHTLGNKNILRTADAYTGDVTQPEIEDLLRDTLVAVAKDDLGWDIAKTATSQPGRPVVDIFADEIGDFSKYRLAKSYLRWTRDHDANDLTATERDQWASLVAAINKSLK
jgi:energy-coupling factor transporter ATP-binding protein EcfA2